MAIFILRIGRRHLNRDGGCETQRSLCCGASASGKDRLQQRDAHSVSEVMYCLHAAMPEEGGREWSEGYVCGIRSPRFLAGKIGVESWCSFFSVSSHSH